MSTAYFITGTDTEIGKTFASSALLHRARQLGRSAAGLKPVAAGTDEDGQNEDVRQLINASSVALPATVVNPYCFPPPIAPHIAAQEAGVTIELSHIARQVETARAAADFVVVEGVGGFRVPLGVDRDTADLAVALGLPVILVVGLRLGCINHALLTAEAIQARGLTLAGWIANTIQPDMSRLEQNFEALCARLPAPCLGRLPHAPSGDPATVAGHLRLP